MLDLRMLRYTQLSYKFCYYTTMLFSERLLTWYHMSFYLQIVIGNKPFAKYCRHAKRMMSRVCAILLINKIIICIICAIRRDEVSLRTHTCYLSRDNYAETRVGRLTCTAITKPILKFDQKQAPTQKLIWVR